MSSRSVHSRRRVPIQRSQIAFAHGAWIGVLTVVMPSAWRTASKLVVYLASRSRSRKPNGAGTSIMRFRACGSPTGRSGARSGREDAPVGWRARCRRTHRSVSGEHGVDVQKVDSENAVSRGGEELPPARSGPSRCGWQTDLVQDGAHGAGGGGRGRGVRRRCAGSPSADFAGQL